MQDEHLTSEELRKARELADAMHAAVSDALAGEGLKRRLVYHALAILACGVAEGRRAVVMVSHVEAGVGMVYDADGGRRILDPSAPPPPLPPAPEMN